MRLRAFLLTIGIGVLTAAAPAHAAVYTVTGTQDPGACDGFACTGLQAALDEAKSTKVADEIHLEKATYAARRRGFTISDSGGVTIVGAGARSTTLTGGFNVRVVMVSGTATLSHLNITGASATDLTGGGIFNLGHLTLDHVEVSGNRAINGAGIANLGALTIRYSLIANNFALNDGGGIYNAGPVGGAGATLAMHDSTVAFNASALTGAGGISMRGGANDSGTLERVTVADNSGGLLGAGGIGIGSGSGVLAARATIVAANTGPSPNCGAITPRDDGFNVESGSDCGFRSGKQDAKPGFPTDLMDDGGETGVLPIPPTSPAVDLVPACKGVTDQRDLARPQGKGCDAGAYELDQPPDTTLRPIASPTTDATPTFTFDSTEAGSTFQCRLDNGGFAACASPYTTPLLSDGNHTFQVRAIDAAGNTDPTPAAQAFVVDAISPTTIIDGGPSGPTNDDTPTFTFSATTAGATFECRLDGPGSGTGSYQPCASPYTAPHLVDGAYSLLVRATDGLNAGEPATRSFVVDTTAPPVAVTGGPTGVTTDTAPAFSFDSSDASAHFVCRLDGPAGPGAEQPCTSPVSFETPAPGRYTLYVTAVDAAGNRTTTSRSFTVAAVQQTTPPPQPVFHQSVVVQPAVGKVLIRRKGTKKFVALDATQGIPLGSEVDARHGKVRLTSLPKAGGAPQTALFYGGIFIVTQSGRITQLALSQPLARCTSAKAATAAAKKKRPKSRNLWGDGRGSFRTKGRYSSATVRGTKWNVRDSCAGTLTRVTRGVVAVRDFATRKTKVLRAGKRYLAKPKRRR